MWLGNLTMGIHKVAATSGPASATQMCQAPCLLGQWLIKASSSVQARAHADLVMHVLQQPGWVINFSKSRLVPSQQFDFIGMKFDMFTYTMTLLPKMWVYSQMPPAMDVWEVLLGCR